MLAEFSEQLQLNPIFVDYALTRIEDVNRARWVLVTNKRESLLRHAERFHVGEASLSDS